MKNSLRSLHPSSSATAGVALVLVMPVTVDVVPKMDGERYAVQCQTFTIDLESKNADNQQTPVAALTTFNPQINILHEWNKKAEKRLDRLIGKQINENITREEFDELQMLMDLREKEHPPRSAHQILQAAKEEEMLESLLRAVKQYVEFTSNH